MSPESHEHLKKLPPNYLSVPLILSLVFGVLCAFLAIVFAFTLPFLAIMDGKGPHTAAYEMTADDSDSEQFCSYESEDSSLNVQITQRGNNAKAHVVLDSDFVRDFEFAPYGDSWNTEGEVASDSNENSWGANFSDPLVVFMLGMTLLIFLSEILFLVFNAVFIYRMYALIRDDTHQFSPWKMVLLSIIPLVNLYGWYKVYAKYPEAFNDYLERHEIALPVRADKSLGLIYYLALLVSIFSCGVVFFFAIPFGFVVKFMWAGMARRMIEVAHRGSDFPIDDSAVKKPLLESLFMPPPVKSKPKETVIPPVKLDLPVTFSPGAFRRLFIGICVVSGILFLVSPTMGTLSSFSNIFQNARFEKVMDDVASDDVESKIAEDSSWVAFDDSAICPEDSIFEEDLDLKTFPAGSDAFEIFSGEDDFAAHLRGTIWASVVMVGLFFLPILVLLFLVVQFLNMFLQLLRSEKFPFTPTQPFYLWIPIYNFYWMYRFTIDLHTAVRDYAEEVHVPYFKENRTFAWLTFFGAVLLIPCCASLLFLFFIGLLPFFYHLSNFADRLMAIDARQKEESPEGF